ncbi:hypothetical protein MCOR25_001128 [Pyricularia grisea]|uniref:BHLH domain-containing protein n=1 Tax=Pyricularia grisea TaxID=148305 RepID=A0A6P8ANH1_PYRGI|nr:uncharacterized protein PgNI_11758 [Pyricularia grisea]KAI6381658.1 hypothetical protein MCOR25_001128 [Pyricularia grisea]TLD03587.1 hypothetical protein PgNI_11758 [Pyricularia grisea]
MPRAAHPLTPASSTDLKGQDGVKQLASLQMAFELPPPAISNGKPGAMTGAFQTNVTASPPAPSPESLSSPKQSPRKTSYPLQASETVKSRRRSSVVQAQAAATAVGAGGKKDTFALPPPPTRSRKIIQMKPKSTGASKTEENDQPQSASKGKTGTSKSTVDSNDTATAAATASAQAPTATGSPVAAKKKTPSATSAAGRKIARKTAHSLIERRRRSKMNEEFATLKNMIPACTGEMHKLAILQASIDYIRYLEDCVSKLQAQREDQSTPMELAPPPTTTALYDDYEMDEEDENHHTPTGARTPYETVLAVTGSTYSSPDVEMGGGGSEVVLSPTLTGQQSHTQHYRHHNASSIHSASISPALMAQDSQRRDSTYSSASTVAAAALITAGNYGHGGRHYSFASTTSATPSPAFGPQAYPTSGYYSTSRPGSTLTSPALGPLRDEQEASAAVLLMLNSDRRGSTTASTGSSPGSQAPVPAGVRGMSVRDLLSS